MRRHPLAAIAALIVLACTATADDEVLPYYRQPAISPDGSTIAFVHAGDIYVVPAAGGMANLVASHEAYDSRPRFSPCGNWLAFTSERTGGGDVYLLHLAEGTLRRLTFHSSADLIEAWSPDGEWVYFSSNRHDLRGNSDIFRVGAAGGTPVPFSRDRYEEEYNCSVSPDGSTIAFNANDGVRQWWRQGPRVDDTTEIWLKSVDPAATDYRRFTTYVGMDSWPMWAPDGAGLSFVSDEGGAENIWFQSLDGERSRITSFDGGRVIWPDVARNEGSIVFERDLGIWLLPPGGDPAPVPITAIADERSNPIQPQTFRGEVSEYALSPDNRKVAFIIHGEVFAAPATKGEDEETPPAFRITDTPARERGLAWSADSNRLLYCSDRGGNMDLYIYDFIAREERRLTETEEQEYFPVASPDGRWCAYYRGLTEIRLIDMEDLSDHPFAEGFFLNEQLYGFPSFAWSCDSAWIAYMDNDDRYFRNLFARRVGEEGEPIQLTYLPNIGGLGPIWSPDGRFIVFSTAQYRSDFQLMRVDLLPIEPEFPEERFDELFAPPEAGGDEGGGGDEAGEEEDEEVTVRIVPEGIRDRISRLAPFATNSFALCLSPDNKQVLFSNRASGRSVLWVANADPARDDNARQLLESSSGIGSIQFASDGKTLWLLDGNAIKSMPLAGGQAKPYALLAEMAIDFHAEKLQVFREAWMMLRDHFYDATFNGLDWPEVYERYLPYARGSRNYTDLSVISNLMMGELNASHMGMRYSAGPTPPGGDLGITFDPGEYLAAGRFRVEDVVPGGPVARQNSDLAAGSYLLAINGVELTTSTNINELIQRAVGRRVVLTYSDDPEGGERQTLAVQPMPSGQVNGFRYRRWVRDNAAYVERISSGRLGYVHIPNMGAGALEQFKLDLDSQVHGREGVVIDVRYNTGGYVAPFVLDVLHRRATMLNAFRGRGRTSAENLAGNRILDLPTVVVQNEQSLSNAEMFAEGYRRLGLGTIVGNGSCGWVIWTWGTRLLNGGYLRLPRLAVTTLEGEDLDEVSRRPDVYVDRPLGQSLTGEDDQLDGAVRVLLEQIDSDDR